MTQPRQPTQPTDGELLAAFAATGDQRAFGELVQRHGAMVYGVCLRRLADHHEAQDAAQAVFLVLARKAAALRRDPSVGGWLHTVARRVARDVGRSRQTRRQREEKAMADPSLPTNPASDRHAFCEVLDDVIGELPERYRRPLVLFHLESKSLEETGQALGLNPNTLRTRLGRSRELLRKKLVARGITIGSVSALTALLSAESGAAVILPATFVASTVGAATGTAAVSASVSALSKGALHMLFIAKVQTVSLAVAACLVVVGSGVVAAKQLSTPITSTEPAPVQVQTAAQPTTETPRFPEVTPPALPTPVKTDISPVELQGNQMLVCFHWQTRPSDIKVSAEKVGVALQHQIRAQLYLFNCGTNCRLRH